MSGFGKKITATKERTYEERVQDARQEGDKGADLFCRFLSTFPNLTVREMGFDHANKNVPFFYNIHPVLRSLPDFVVVGDKGQITYCHIKGTTNIKLDDIYRYRAFHDLFAIKDEWNKVRIANSIIVFADDPENITYLTLSTLQAALVNKTIRSYPDNIPKPYVSISKQDTAPLKEEIFL